MRSALAVLEDFVSTKHALLQLFFTAPLKPSGSFQPTNNHTLHREKFFYYLHTLKAFEARFVKSIASPLRAVSG